MAPGKKVVVISHCILNQNVVVHGLERASGCFPFVHDLLNAGIGLLQLPCPEFQVLGPLRPPMSFEDYNRMPGYRKRCDELIKPIIEQLTLYSSEGYQYFGVIGIHESPNCSISGQRGVLMQEFFDACIKNCLSTNFLEVPVDYTQENEGNFRMKLDEFLKVGEK